MFTKPVPEIDVHMLAEKLKSDEAFVLVDVREAWELNLARITDTRMAHAPLSQLSAQGMAALPGPAQSPEGRVYVLCHHGIRSADVTRWLSANGWKNIFSVRGGIDEYARKIDKSVGFY
jgi:rhodanese-related sulfurtransferase